MSDCSCTFIYEQKDEYKHVFCPRDIISLKKNKHYTPYISTFFSK